MIEFRSLFITSQAFSTFADTLILLKQFKTGTKYSGSSLAWSVSTAVFGGSTLLINEFLVGRLDLLFGPGLYMSLSALICLITVGCICKKSVQIFKITKKWA